MAGPPTLTVSSTIVKPGASITLTFTGGYAMNFVGYDYCYADSNDDKTWGTWSESKRYFGMSPGGSTSMATNPNPGGYRKYYARSVGNRPGNIDYSSWAGSPSVLTHVEPKPPTSFTAAPAVFASGNITLTWSGAVKGSNAIDHYLISVATSEDSKTWSVESLLAKVSTSDTQGSYSYAPGSIAQFVRYSICAVDNTGSKTPLLLSNLVARITPPPAPQIIVPRDGSTTYNKYPRFCIRTKEEPNRQLQIVYVKSASGAWLNSVDNADRFSKGGSLADNTTTVFTHEYTHPGKVSISFHTRNDNGLDSIGVTRAFTVREAQFSVISANETIIKAAHMLALRSAINTVRDYYGLAAYAWAEEIMAGRTKIRSWGRHIKEIRAAVEAVIDFINLLDAGTSQIIPPVEWLPLGEGRPRADVMIQLQEVITQL